MDVDVMIGTIMPWPLDWAPKGWAMCNGQLLPVNQNEALFSLLGIQYGGDGKQNFALPNLCGKFLMGAPDPSEIGQNGGELKSTGTVAATGKVSIAVTNLPAHKHAATFTPGTAASASVAIPVDSDSNATDSVPGATMVLGKPVSGTVGVKAYSTGDKTDTLKPFDVALPAATGTVATADTGDGTALDVSVAGTATVPTVPPYLTMNYIIALQGIFPSRS